jgi:CxxC motif-containing protein (DUF1111 family)
MPFRRRLGPVIAGSTGMLLVACADDSRSPTAPTAAQFAMEEEEVEFEPLKQLTTAQLAQFFAGQAVFDRVFVQEDGLGPIFNASACAECHEDPGSGGPGDEVETHFSHFNGSTCDLLVADGGNVLQDSTTALLFAATGFTKEPETTVPHEKGSRTTPDVLGFGLFDNIPDAAIAARADPNDANGDGISGRVHMVGGRVGRFGRKAGDATLDGFNAGAFLQEMGITNPEHPEENNIGGLVIGEDIDPAVDPVPESPGVTELTQGELNALNAFMRFLAPPRKLPLSATAMAGKDVFKNIGCLNCHVENMTTGPSSVAALNMQPVHPFSDFLLHDIGTGGASDNCQGAATPQEFRTEPLTGLRFSVDEGLGLLHDGSALTIQAAILRHGVEAANSRARFNALTAGQKKALIEYLRAI